MTGAAGTPDLVEVRLRNVPLELRNRSQQQGDELIREMALIRQGSDSGQASHVPDQLLAVADEVATVYAPFTGASMQQLEEAFERGESEVAEVVYRVPPAFAEFARQIEEVLTQVDEYCRAGQHLLALASPADIAAYRAWALSEFQRQIAGEPPRSWLEYRAQHPGSS